jgi:hypothetical protein
VGKLFEIFPSQNVLTSLTRFLMHDVDTNNNI